jgi:16S rRNA G527 N7-methylase RsmG
MTKLEELKAAAWAVHSQDAFAAYQAELKKINKENSMTKLEELKAAWNDARDDSWAAAWYADNALWDDDAWGAYYAAEAAEDDACDAYYDELKKTKEQTNV